MSEEKNASRTLHPLLYLLIGSLLALLLAKAISSGGFFFPFSDPIWSAMQSRGTWRVGMDPSFPPFESLDAEGKPAGYDLDLAQLFADEWGLQLEIVPIGFDSLLDALRTGQIDSVISALPFDPRTTQDVTYSEPYFEAGIRLAVRSSDAEQMRSTDVFEELSRDMTASAANGNEGNNNESNGTSIQIRKNMAALLSGKEVAVEWGSMGDMVGRQLQRIDPTIELFPYETPNEVIIALQDNSNIGAVLIDNITLLQFQRSQLQSGQSPNPASALIEIGPAVEGNPYVIAMPYRSSKLQTEINCLLQMFQASGRLSDLEQIWFSP